MALSRFRTHCLADVANAPAAQISGDTLMSNGFCKFEVYFGSLNGKRALWLQLLHVNVSNVVAIIIPKYPNALELLRHVAVINNIQKEIALRLSSSQKHLRVKA